jgi:hypothetical protein
MVTTGSRRQWVLRIWPAMKRGSGEHSSMMVRSSRHGNEERKVDLEAVEYRGALGRFI